MKRNSLFVVLFIVVGLSGPSIRAQAPVEKVDVQNSRVFVYIAKKGAGHEHGVEGRLASGSVRLGQAATAGEMVFDLRAFRADTDDARRYVGLPVGTDASTQTDVTNNMQGASVLDTAQFPTARFAIDSVRPVNAAGLTGTPYQFDGELELHGVKRKMSFLAGAESIDGGRIRVRGGFPLKQTDFGIKPFSKLLGAIGIADELRIYGDIYLAP